MIIPSTPQSECSTLVDFAIEDLLAKEEDEDEAITDEYMLESDNSAWSNGRYTPAQVPANRDELLSSENAAWVTARPSARQAKPKTRSWFAAGRNNQAMSMTGCESARNA
ncbi:hypothetical protein BN946_scf184867.g10 [Trametes cinnabarina]|uniref:Uncharacterized protein n=1 Tax=Pycnoporus cinnabarinus TaxID=5643 RepID=A0A060SIT3_PYCCI|nr:hypothetical protein BN946_scf184867.g10 [Trametes cinnabarina]